MNRKTLTSFLLLVAMAPCVGKAAEELPEKYRRWLEEEVTYIISTVERETFLSLGTEAEREAFVEAFWTRRDTNPSTLENEYREEHYDRLRYANEFFGRETFRPGWMTDRGRYYIILGPPTDRQDFSYEDSVYPTELWFYNNPALKYQGLPPFFYLLFFRRHGAGELELYSPITDGPEELLAGYQRRSADFRRDAEEAYDTLYEISPELAHASISFRTDEGDIVQFQAPSFGTQALLDQIAVSPLRSVDTAYAEHFYLEKGNVESDYLFNYVSSWSETHVLPGPGGTHYLHWVIEVDPQAIALVKDEDKGLYGSMFILSVDIVSRDDPDRTLMTSRKESFVTFTESQAQSGVHRPFTYSGMTPIVPGSFELRTILRNRACAGRDESSCRKSYAVLESTIEVPPWGSAERRLTPLVLAYGTERPDGEPLYRPYRFGSLQILPNPRHVYAIGDSLVVMADAVGRRSEWAARFRIVNRETPDTVAVERTVPLGEPRLEPLVQELPLAGLGGGRYRLEVDLIDEAGGVRDARSTDFEITPRTAVARPFLRGAWPLISPEIPGLVEMSLGEQYSNLGNKDKARELFEASIAANSRFGPAREALSRLLLEDGASARVIELLEPIHRSDPKRYEVLALLGEAYFQEGNYSKTTELLEDALLLRPPDSRLLNQLAMSHYRLGNHREAKDLLKRSLSLQPDQPEIKRLLEKLEAGTASREGSAPA